MRYVATIDGRDYEIIIDDQGRVTVDGVEVLVDLQRLGRLNLYSVLIDNTSYEVAVEQGSPQGDYAVSLAGVSYEVRVEQSARRQAKSNKGTSLDGQNEIRVKAPIPGLVVSVPIEPGQCVAAGDTLVVLEAMKMENALRAPRAGVIHRVEVKAGAQVSSGQVLVILR